MASVARGANLRIRAGRVRTLAKNLSPATKTESPKYLSGPALAWPRSENVVRDSSIGWGRENPPTLDPRVPADRSLSPCMRSTRDSCALQKTPPSTSRSPYFQLEPGARSATVPHAKMGNGRANLTHRDRQVKSTTKPIDRDSVGQSGPRV